MLTYTDKLKVRKNYLMGLCSKTVVDFILHNNSINETNKLKALEIAKEIAKKSGRNRIYWKDFEKALKVIKMVRLK